METQFFFVPLETIIRIWQELIWKSISLTDIAAQYFVDTECFYSNWEKTATFRETQKNFLLFSWSASIKYLDLIHRLISVQSWRDKFESVDEVLRHQENRPEKSIFEIEQNTSMFVQSRVLMNMNVNSIFWAEPERRTGHSKEHITR